MIIHLLEGSLKIQVYYCEDDVEFEDNICIEVEEDCPDDEKLLQANQVIISITPVEARQLATLLNQAADVSLADRETRSANNED